MSEEESWAPAPGGPATASQASVVSFPEGEGTASVWLVQHASHYLRMHECIELRRGDGARVFEVRGFRLESPLERILSLGGFTSMDAPSFEAADVTHEGPFLAIMGFDLPAGVALGDVELALEEALTGRSGGFAAVAMGQVGFHRAPLAFPAAWRAARWPGIALRQPRHGIVPVRASRHGEPEADR